MSLPERVLPVVSVPDPVLRVPGEVASDVSLFRKVFPVVDLLEQNFPVTSLPGESSLVVNLAGDVLDVFPAVSLLGKSSSL